jgi:MFS transporter, PAT family, beta-lactamase induction signal transducer AmpG
MLVITTHSLKKLGLLGSLYVTQLIPLSFFSQALPVFMRQQGASLKTIGLLSLLGLPWMFKFLWAPLIDRYGFTSFGHYRFWIICFQTLAVFVLLVCALVDVQAGNFRVAMVWLALMCLVCASQDIATDALAVGLLDPQERGLGNGVQTSGNYLGIVIGGGGMLIWLNRWGWRSTFLTMAIVMLVALLPILYHRESERTATKPNPTDNTRLTASDKNYFSLFISFCCRPGMWRWLLAVVFYMAGSYMALAMFRPLLVDIGLSLEEIGLLLGVVGSTAGMFGAIAAGSVIAALGRKRSLIVFGLLRAAVLMAYILPAIGFTDRPILYLVVISVQFALSMASTATFTVMMDKSEPETAGTDYTIQNSVMSLSAITASAASGVIAVGIGYTGVFVLSAAIAIASVVMIAIMIPEVRTTQPEKEPKNIVV